MLDDDNPPSSLKRQVCKKVPEDNSSRCDDSNIPSIAGLLLCVGLRWGQLYGVCDSLDSPVNSWYNNHSNRVVGMVQVSN